MLDGACVQVFNKLSIYLKLKRITNEKKRGSRSAGVTFTRNTDKIWSGQTKLKVSGRNARAQRAKAKRLEKVEQLSAGNPKNVSDFSSDEPRAAIAFTCSLPRQ